MIIGMIKAHPTQDRTTEGNRPAERRRDAHCGSDQRIRASPQPDVADPVPTRQMLNRSGTPTASDGRVVYVSRHTGMT